MKLALFASGNGSNVQALIDAVNNGTIKGTIQCLVCDNPKAYVIERAQAAGIDTLVIPPNRCSSRVEWENVILEFLQSHQVDLVILAGFMRIISSTLLNHYPKGIINIHPSLLPAFPGRNSIQDAYDAKVEKTGVTIHYVDEGIDTGEIIAQESLNIQAEWSLELLEEAIHKIEHRLYPKVIQQLIEEFNMKGNME